MSDNMSHALMLNLHCFHNFIASYEFVWIVINFYELIVTSKILPLVDYKIRPATVWRIQRVWKKSTIFIKSHISQGDLFANYKGLSVSFVMALTLYFLVSGISDFQFSILEYLICICNAFYLSNFYEWNFIWCK